MSEQETPSTDHDTPDKHSELLQNQSEPTSIPKIDGIASDAAPNNATEVVATSPTKDTASPMNSVSPEETGPAETGHPETGHPESDHNAPGFSVFSRAAVACFGLVPIVLLAITMLLSPSKEGLGTHQQLGLPPCSMRVIFSIRCPACGMTTSWAHFVRGAWISSAQANPGGFMLALYSLVFAAVCFYCVRRNRMPPYRVQDWMIKSLLAIALITVAHWITVVWLPKIGL